MRTIITTLPNVNEASTRRTFLKSAAASVAWLGSAPFILRSAEANSRVRVGIMGVNGRGQAHIDGFAAIPGVEVAWVCDVDSRALERGAAAVAKKQAYAPKTTADFRRILDDSSVDVLSIAAPNHWHAPASILACAAGKHVYVEKPGSHNLAESRWIMEAARKHKRVVQLGNQRRSWPWVQEAIRLLHADEIGTLRMARTWYNNTRGSIGRGKPAPIPAGLDFTLWQGPAPDRPYVDNLVHYNWHWRWHWGGGELANNGVHALDVARWGLRVDYPERVTCGGGRYHFQDDQETPDVYISTFDYPKACITWESQSCHPNGFEGEDFGIHFYGDRGSMIIGGSRAVVFDLKQKVIREIKGAWDDKAHFANFIDCLRTGQRPNSDIADCQISAGLCHLGNIAYRTRQTLSVNSADGSIQGNRQAAKFATREYRRGWEVTV